MRLRSQCCIQYLTAIVLLSTLATSVSQAQVIVGHRGASYDAPENALAAFKLAWQQNADGIEGDFYVTKDQQVVCIHDADTQRRAGKKLFVARSTLAELREFRHTYEGSMKGKPRKGEETLAINGVTKMVQISWFDDVHMSNANSFSEGEATERGFSVSGNTTGHPANPKADGETNKSWSMRII